MMINSNVRSSMSIEQYHWFGQQSIIYELCIHSIAYKNRHVMSMFVCLFVGNFAKKYADCIVSTKREPWLKVSFPVNFQSTTEKLIATVSNPVGQMGFTGNPSDYSKYYTGIPLNTSSSSAVRVVFVIMPQLKSFTPTPICDPTRFRLLFMMCFSFVRRQKYCCATQFTFAESFYHCCGWWLQIGIEWYFRSWRCWFKKVNLKLKISMNQMPRKNKQID